MECVDEHFKDQTMPKTDDLSAWRQFLCFARTGTLSAAAKALETEPSSLSRAIAGLEKALGTELIQHNSRPLRLTPAGKTAQKRMETILRAHDSLMTSLMDANRTLDGSIRLSSAPGFASRRLTPLLSEFQKAHPEIRIEILSGLQEAELKKGLCEVATLTGEPKTSGLVYMSRGRNVYLPVASPGYIRRYGMPVNPEDLKLHTGYIYNGPVRSETRVLFRGTREAPVQFARSIRSTDILAIRNALLSDMELPSTCRSFRSPKTLPTDGSCRSSPAGFIRPSNASSPPIAMPGIRSACAYSLNGMRSRCRRSSFPTRKRFPPSWACRLMSAIRIEIKFSGPEPVKSCPPKTRSDSSSSGSIAEPSDQDAGKTRFSRSGKQRGALRCLP